MTSTLGLRALLFVLMCVSFVHVEAASAEVIVVDNVDDMIVDVVVCKPNAEQQALLDLHNNHRREGGQCGRNNKAMSVPLRYNCKLADAALRHAHDMLDNAFIGHRGSDGSDLGVRATRVGYQWRRIGENVAEGFTTVAAVNEAWISSEGHCNNILNGDFTDMGAARVNDYWAVMFGRE